MPDVLGLVDLHQHDRQVARDPVRPQRVGAARVAREHVRRRPQRPVRVEDAAGQALEEMRLVGRDAEVVQLHLRLRPGQRGRAVERRRIAVLLREVEGRRRATARRASRRRRAPSRRPAPRTRRRRLTIGSSTAPVVPDSGRPSITAAGVRIPRPRPRKRARSVSHCRPPTVSPSTTTTWASQTGGLAASTAAGGSPAACRARARTRSARTGWRTPGGPASAAGGASTISAYDVTSISRVRGPRFVSETRRTSASSSGDTITSSVVPDRPVAPNDLRPVLGERDLVAVRRAAARLVAGRPALAAVDVAKEHVRPPRRRA